ncbi:MAG: Na+/proline symporter/signal transduction histidine kinase [Oceanicoccus sp.]|jgi:Na+/proline symporter/signal transduction histidine kinase
MNLDLSLLFFIGLGYLLLLFGIAHIADRGWIPERLIHHPLTYVLSLGVFTSAWAIYGVVGMANDYGYGFLSYYLGISGAFIFAPLLLLPILRITRTYLHSSLADLITFRYRTQWAGSLVTVFMILAVWPMLALQIQAVADSLHILTTDSDTLFTRQTRHNQLAFIFCVVICVFTISFGSKHLTAHERHNGLVAAIAFESVFKLLAIMAVGLVAVYQVFDGFGGLDLWLEQHPQILSQLNYPRYPNSARTMLLIFLSAAVAMPHLFHMIFAENPNLKAMQTASWGLPLFLLLMSLPVLPILWAGLQLESPLPTEYFSLAIGIELDSPGLALLVYLGGLSAASGAVIVTTLAMASMCLKHLILPIYRPGNERDIYRWLLWIRRLLIVLIILSGYLFYRLMESREALSSLGIAAFIGTLQFLPGVMAALYWQGANRKGFIAGLITGFGIWFITMLLPIMSTFDPDYIAKLYFNLNYDELWSAVAIGALGMNIIVFILVSLLTKTSAEERVAAEICSTDDLSRPARRLMSVQNPSQMKEQLSIALGTRTAQREVDRAVQELHLPHDESRPFALRRLRYRLEANLSGLLGPSVAHEMVNQLLPYEDSSGNNEDINLIEGQLEHYKVHLTGLAADLDNLRRYHRRTLQDLPVGVCSLGQDDEVLMWNHAIARFTGIDSAAVVGSNLHSLPSPWAKTLSDFIAQASPHLYKQHLPSSQGQHWFNLHKTTVDAEGASIDGRVIVLEDTTDVQVLEDELLHSERLASIGRLAAGVAHEIGNPVTGIACLAQNLRYDTDNPESLETGRQILEQTDRVSKIVHTLVNFAHAGTEGANHELGPVHLKACAEEAIHLLKLNTGAKQVEFSNDCPDDCYVIGDSQRLLQVFVNLLSNARDASPEFSTVSINSTLQGQQVIIAVTDRGTGISKALQEQIFDPFFTTKEPGEGTGLGLSLVYSIIDDLGGHISVDSPADPVNGGTRFSIRLNHHDGSAA